MTLMPTTARSKLSAIFAHGVADFWLTMVCICCVLAVRWRGCLSKTYRVTLGKIASERGALCHQKKAVSPKSDQVF